MDAWYGRRVLVQEIAAAFPCDPGPGRAVLRFEPLAGCSRPIMNKLASWLRPIAQKNALLIVCPLKVELPMSDQNPVALSSS